jgi:GT2 family glycosyltransferase
MEAIINSIPHACLIVVDNSGDFIAINPHTRVINAGGNIGFGKASNLGASHADSEFVLFLNPDTVITPETILGMIECAPDRVQAIWAPAVLDHAGKVTTLTMPGRFGLMYCRGYISNKFYSSTGIAALYVSGACMMLRTSFFRALGGFCPDIFLYAEDLEMCSRAKEMGANILIFTDLRVKHIGGKSSARWISRFLRFSRSWKGHYSFLRKRANPLIAALNAAHLATGLRV